MGGLIFILGGKRMKPEIECPHSEDAKMQGDKCPFAKHCNHDCKYRKN